MRKARYGVALTRQQVHIGDYTFEETSQSQAWDPNSTVPNAGTISLAGPWLATNGMCVLALALSPSTRIHREHAARFRNGKPSAKGPGPRSNRSQRND
jgi:hypothetical protein